MVTPSEAIERGIEAFTALVRDDPAPNAELESSVRTFFGGAPPAGDAQATLLAARRHLEWFLLERHSPALFGTPVERLLEVWRERVGEEVAEQVPALLDSFAGVFRVGDVSPGQGAWLVDLAGFGSYALQAPDAPLADGDLLVGRLFPIGGGLHAPSLATALFRDAALVSALETDLARIRDRAGSNVLHLGQHELEAMFWGAGRLPVPEDPVAEARAFLARSGLDDERIERILRHLRDHPGDPERLLHGAHDALGDVLDELAFETRIDLDGARRALASAWTALSAPRPPAEPSRTAGPAPRDARAAVDAFAAGRAQGAELDTLIHALQRDLDLPEGEDDDGPDTPAPDFPGVVGAMVEEFLWETERVEGSERAESLRSVRLLGEYGARIGVFEDLDATELLRFTTFWIPEKNAVDDAQHARNLLAALDAFCTWAEHEHDLPLHRDFGGTLASLRESLPRTIELNRFLEEPPADDTGELYEVRADSRGRFAGLRDRHGNDHAAAPEASLAERLRPGDRLRGTISLEGVLTVYRCYPPEAAGLLDR